MGSLHHSLSCHYEELHNLAEMRHDACRMAVLNDFEANGYGVTALDEKHVVVLNDVPATEKACLVPPVITAGFSSMQASMLNVLSPESAAHSQHWASELHAD